MPQSASQTATITTLSHDGRGIAHINGKTTFLRGGLPEEHVEFSYLKKHAKYDEGQVVSVLKAAAERIQPICPHFGICGGCSLQHMHPQAQILAKQNILLEQLLHIGGVIPQTLLPPLTSNTGGYRSKARLGVKYVEAKNKVLVGFRELNGRYIADIHTCAVLDQKIGNKINELSEFIYSLEAYRSIPQIEVATSHSLVALIFRHLHPLSAQDLAKFRQFAQTTQFHLYLQPGGPQTIHKLYPEDHCSLLNYELPDQNISLQFHPADFTQINPGINQQMVTLAIQLLNPRPNERILDLFCGLGNFTLPLAKYCREIIGVEGASESILRAKMNAELNQLFHAHFYCTDLTQDISSQPWATGFYDTILLDPPRTGAAEIIPFIGRFRPHTILYVSCNPATLARDSKMLTQQGYQLTHAGVMDMFPHTSHVESIALFNLNSEPNHAGA